MCMGDAMIVGIEIVVGFEGSELGLGSSGVF